MYTMCELMRRRKTTRAKEIDSFSNDSGEQEDDDEDDEVVDHQLLLAPECAAYASSCGR